MSVSRRDQGPRERSSIPIGQFVGDVATLLGEFQQGLFDRARDFRERHTVQLADRAAVVDFFERPAEKDSAVQGGFAHVHVADDPAVAAAFDPLKVTVRCATDADDPGTCIVTGRPVATRSVLARSY